MQERIPDSDYQQLQYFISESDWDAQGVMMEVARRTQASLSGQRGEQGLILEESGWEKSGKKSAGVARQYIGQVGKVANGQVGVFAALTRGGLVGLQVRGCTYPKSGQMTPCAVWRQACPYLHSSTRLSPSWQRRYWPS
jgi:SRSO17 transposase